MSTLNSVVLVDIGYDYCGLCTNRHVQVSLFAVEQQLFFVLSMLSTRFKSFTLLTHRA
jgi:hypothetical protein